MTGNRQAYRDAFERAREGKNRTLLQRLLFPFQDHYTQQSREEGERDGMLAREEADGESPAPPAVH